MGAIRRLLDGLTFKALRHRLDKRLLQQELDTHRLFLLTSHYQHTIAQQEGQAYVDALAARAEQLSFEQMRSAVEACLHAQLCSISAALHAELQSDADTAQPPADLHGRQQSAPYTSQQEERFTGNSQRLQDRLGMPGVEAQAVRDACQLTAATQAVAGQTAAYADSSQCSTARRITMQQLSDRLQARLGYTLSIAPSSLQHCEAGAGLWLRGAARAGSVVSLYPGLVYTAQQYRRLPGYPRVDQGNPYLMARFDGIVLDARPWGHGTPNSQSPASDLPDAALDGVTVEQRWNVARLRRLREWRHPLALAHMANHPSPGLAPNIMVAAYNLDLAGTPTWLSTYLPLLAYQDPPSQRLPPTTGAGGDQEVVRGLALVALRDLADEELLLNYRLSPHVTRPAWYTPVDAEEDARRWA